MSIQAVGERGPGAPKALGIMHDPLIIPLIIFQLISLFSACSSVNPKEDETEAYRNALWSELPGPNVHLTDLESGAFNRYVADFRARMGPAPEHDEYLGRVPSGREEIFIHALALRPGNDGRRDGTGGNSDGNTEKSGGIRRGTAFVFHGFASESSRYSALSAALLREGWNVLLVDLPGHGLSTGKRGHAADFSLYGDAVHQTLQNVSAYLGGPYVAIGHSTGALAIMDYSVRYEQAFHRVVFFAPLVRTVYWPVLRFVRTITSPWIHSLRAFSTSDLGLRVFPVAWFDGLVKWNKDMQSRKSLGLPATLLLQAQKDSVVDNKFNLDFVKKRTPAGLSYRRLLGADHYNIESINPDPEMLNEILRFIAKP